MMKPGHTTGYALAEVSAFQISASSTMLPAVRGSRRQSPPHLRRERICAVKYSRSISMVKPRRVHIHAADLISAPGVALHWKTPDRRPPDATRRPDAVLLQVATGAGVQTSYFSISRAGSPAPKLHPCPVGPACAMLDHDELRASTTSRCDGSHSGMIGVTSRCAPGKDPERPEKPPEADGPGGGECKPIAKQPVRSSAPRRMREWQQRAVPSFARQGRETPQTVQPAVRKDRQCLQYPG